MATIVVFPISDDYLSGYTDCTTTFPTLTPAELFTAIRNGTRLAKVNGVTKGVQHPRHAKGRFNVRKRKPKVVRGGLILFQYRTDNLARVVAIARVVAVHGRDTHSLADSSGWIELCADTIRCCASIDNAPTASDIQALFPTFKFSRIQNLSEQPDCPTIEQWEAWFTAREFA